jgi:hypothetical protein
MKRNLFLLSGGGGAIIVALACVLFFAGCKSDDEDAKIDAKLVGTWTYAEAQRSFEIKTDGSFTANLFVGTSMTVTGKLTAEGDEYIMSSLKETTGSPAGAAVSSFNGESVSITVTEDTFFLAGTGEQALTVSQMFGGTYTKQ